MSHPLEMWGDARAYDGTVSIIQPLIAPLYQSRSAYEILAAFNREVTDKSTADQPGPQQIGLRNGPRLLGCTEACGGFRDLVEEIDSRRIDRR